MFGFLGNKKSVPASDTDRLALIRLLMRRRYEHDPNVREMLGMMGVEIEDFDATMILSSPEASIMRIVEQHVTGRERGARDDVLIPFLNQSHAAALAQAGQELPLMEPPLTLEHYLAHFLGHVHSNGVPIDPAFIPIGIREVRAFYGR